MDDLLFPVNHSILYYPGFDALPPFIVDRMGRIDAARYAQITCAIGTRLEDLFTDQPIPYRRQNGGEYDIQSLSLKPGIEVNEQYGFRLHIQPVITEWESGEK